MRGGGADTDKQGWERGKMAGLRLRLPGCSAAAVRPRGNGGAQRLVMAARESPGRSDGGAGR